MPHFLDFLFGQFMLAPDLNKQSVTVFLDFVRAYLNKNPVVGTVMVDYGVGLKLSDGTTVRLAGPPPAAVLPSYAIPISCSTLDATAMTTDAGATAMTTDAGAIAITGHQQ